MEPLNKGHVGASNVVLCREIVCSSEVQHVLIIWENEHFGTLKCVLCREVISIVSSSQRVLYWTVLLIIIFVVFVVALLAFKQPWTINRTIFNCKDV